MTRKNNKIDHELERTKDKRSFQQTIQLLMVLMIPIMGLITVTIGSFYSSLRNYQETVISSNAFKQSISVVDLVTNLQIERGKSSMFISTPDDDLYNDVLVSHSATDQSFHDAIQWKVGMSSEINQVPNWLDSKSSYIARLKRHRMHYDKVTLRENIHFYTNATIAIITSMTNNIVLPSIKDVWRQYIAFNALLFSGDTIGIQRAIGSSMITSCRIFSFDVRWLETERLRTTSFIENAFFYSKLSLNRYTQIMKNYTHLNQDDIELFNNATFIKVCNKTTLEYRLRLGKEYFQAKTDFILVLTILRRYIVDDILNDIEQLRNKEYILLITYTIVMGVVIILAVSVTLFVKNITDKIKRYAVNMILKTEELQNEKKETDRLLYQMIPATVAEQLKLNQKVEAEFYNSVTVFFSDIVHFTELASSCSPIDIVDLLNSLYSIFDNCMDQFDCYKVETIGDSYMAVSGLPIRNGTDHVREISRLALYMLAAIQNFTPTICEKPLEIRIGIHSGDCVAGVVGVKMPRYCLFGDTVNTASRMESNSKPNKIHISETTNNLLMTYGYMITQPRTDKLQVKGKGEMQTYWLIGEK